MLGVQIMLIKISLLLLHPLHQPQKHSNTWLCALHIISLSLFPRPDSWSRRLFPVAGRWAISRQVCLIWRGSGCDVYHSVCWVATHSRCDRLISLPPFSSFKTVFSLTQPPTWYSNTSVTAWMLGAGHERGGCFLRHDWQQSPGKQWVERQR